MSIPSSICARSQVSAQHRLLGRARSLVPGGQSPHEYLCRGPRKSVKNSARQLVVLLVGALRPLDDRPVGHVPDERAQPVLLRLDAALALAAQPHARRAREPSSSAAIREQVVRERPVQERVAAHRGSMSV